jgi:hypothetical protein
VPVNWHLRFSPAPKTGNPQRFLEDLARGAVTQGLVQTLVVVKFKVSSDAAPRLGNVLVSLQVHLLVFEAAPEPLDEDIVPEAPTSVHADRDAVISQHIEEVITS